MGYKDEPYKQKDEPYKQKEKPSNSTEAEPEGTEKWLIDLLVKGGYLPEGQDLDDRSAAFLLDYTIHTPQI